MRSEIPQLTATGELQAMRKLMTQAWRRFSDWRRQRLGIRGMLLFVLSSPLVLAAIIALAQGELTTFAGSAGAMSLLVLGARLNRKGMLERLVAPRRRFTRAKQFPHQQIALALVTLGVALAAFTVAGHGIATSAVFAALAASGFHLAYRLPPRGRVNSRSLQRRQYRMNAPSDQFNHWRTARCLIPKKCSIIWLAAAWPVA